MIPSRVSDELSALKIILSHTTNERHTMKNELSKVGRLGLVLALPAATPSTCRAGHAMKWEELPEAVGAAVLANGGTAGQSVDRENGKINGKAVYEAGVKDKDGSTADLVITEDGKLVETKHDDAADRAQELAKA